MGKLALAAAALAAAAIIPLAPVAEAQPQVSVTESDTDDWTWATYEFVQALQDESDKWGLPVELQIQEIPYPGVPAATPIDTNIIVLDESGAAEVPDYFASQSQESQDSGFWPKACTPIRFVAVHEFGHVLANANHRVAYETIANKYVGQNLTGVLPGYSLDSYGEVNAPEAASNAFAAVECGAPTNTVEQDLYTILINAQ